ncbi:MAG: MBL fold metallo-hydrolase [Peptococcaceae bacterium]|nr:MBL fold metallo-hydrolase [Peptococcaceae bacterium]
MRLQFLGAAGTVTGSSYLLETAESRIMIDCGMFQGPKEVRERNYGNFPVHPRTVQHILLTHAHIDHSGLIPKFVKQGFRGRIYATSPTVELCEVLLPDSAHIQEMEVERKNRKARRADRALIEPIYTANDAFKSLSQFSLVMYDEMVQVTPDIKARFVDAGHILGSAMIEVWVKEGNNQVKLVFSGDIGNKNRPLINDPSAVGEADYIIMESTYGNRLHEQCEQEIDILHNVIWETYKKGGNVIIPAFAVERTQDLLYHLNILLEEGRMPPMTVYIDSPLASAATAIFRRNREFYDREANEVLRRGRDPLFWPGVKFTQSLDESKALNNVTSGAIIISASGMCEAGRIRHHLKYNLWRPECTVLFVGFQPKGTLGRQLLDGEKMVRILGDDIAVRADIRYIECYSAHADQAGLLDWVRKFAAPPREIFVTHGEPESSATLARLIRTEFGYNVTVPVWQQTVDLLRGAAEEDQVRKAFASIADRMQVMLKAGLGAEEREELLRRLGELEGYLQAVQSGSRTAAGVSAPPPAPSAG